jgi:two-component system, LytTR family, sensor kinase
MKTKIFIITLICFYFNQSLFSNDSVYNGNQENLYWKFIKERLFSDDSQFVPSFQYDIFIKLIGASHQDSIIIDGLIKELSQLIPNKKIRYSKDESSPFNNRMTIGFNDLFHMSRNNINGRWNYSPLLNGNQIFHDEGINQVDMFVIHIKITFNDTVSFSERKRYIYYAVLRSLCPIKGDPRKAKTFIDSAIYNGFDYNPANTVFTEADKFLIKKYYSSDFLEQYKNYIVGKYSWWYYLKTVKKKSMEVRGGAIAVIFALLLFFAFYYLILRRNFKYKFLGYVLPGLSLSFSFALVNLVYNLFATNITMASHLFNGASIIIIATILSTLLYFLEKLIIKPTMSFTSLLVTKVVSLLAISIAFFGILYFVGPDLDEFINASILSLALAVGRGVILILNEVSDSLIRKKDVELSKLKELKAQAEVQSLHARINPHFLYNSLNSIAGLAHSNPEKTEKMALSLSDLYRYTINRNNELMSTVADEVDMVKSYFEIEQIRFGERMSFNIEVDKGLESHLIPKFIMQALIENAIKHGISKIEGHGEISVGIHKIPEGITIEVADNGPDFTEGLVGGYGLQSLYDLLKLSYGNNAEVNWQNKPKKMIYVIIKTNIQAEKHEVNIL